MALVVGSKREEWGWCSQSSPRVSPKVGSHPWKHCSIALKVLKNFRRIPILLVTTSESYAYDSLQLNTNGETASSLLPPSLWVSEPQKFKVLISKNLFTLKGISLMLQYPDVFTILNNKHLRLIYCQLFKSPLPAFRYGFNIRAAVVSNMAPANRNCKNPSLI